MPKEWTEDEIRKLKRLREIGASAVRASLALKRNKAAVRAKARELGIAFPDRRTFRTEQRMKEAEARVKAGLPMKPI
jgi:hypothetical protein